MPAPGALADLRAWHRPLLIMVGFMIGLTLVASVGLLIDSRQILNESVWLKPFKFAVSFALYGATLAWLLARLDPSRRVLRRVGWWSATLLAATGVVDVAFIGIQAARGTFSHFNPGSDPFTQIGQTVFMGGVILLFLANLVLAVAILVQRVGGPALIRASAFGLVLAVAGMAVAFVLAGAGHETVVSDAYGRTVVLGSSHTIGAAPGGPGLPLVGWSTTGGDLRVPHFFGMHAIHLLLGLVVLLTALRRRVAWLRSERVRGRLLTIAGLGCSGLLVLLTVQAVRGESVIAPDSQLLGLAAVVLAGCVLGAVAVVRAALRADAENTPARADSTATTAERVEAIVK
jgi:hypothetical protein